MKVYLAAPLFTLEERNHNIEIKQMLEGRIKDLEVCLPQCVEADDSGIAQDILRDDLNLLDGCDAVLALCNGPDVDSGTAFEIGYALAKGKDVVVYRNDRRPYLNAMIGGMPCIVDSYDAVVEHFKQK